MIITTPPQPPTRVIALPYKTVMKITKGARSAWVLPTDQGDMFLYDVAKVVGIPNNTLYARVFLVWTWKDERLLLKNHYGGGKNLQANNNIDRVVKKTIKTKRRNPESIKIGTWEKKHL